MLLCTGLIQSKVAVPLVMFSVLLGAVAGIVGGVLGMAGVTMAAWIKTMVVWIKTNKNVNYLIADL